MFQVEVISSNISRFQVIMEKTESNDISGILYNDFYGFLLEFHGIRHMLDLLDRFFDYVNFPQATHGTRSFYKVSKKEQKLPPEEMREVTAEEMEGKNPTFILHVQFRQHSSWQGTLQLISQKKTNRFRSELEMIKLISDALEQ